MVLLCGRRALLFGLLGSALCGVSCRSSGLESVVTAVASPSPVAAYPAVPSATVVVAFTPSATLTPTPAYTATPTATATSTPVPTKTPAATPTAISTVLPPPVSIDSIVTLEDARKLEKGGCGYFTMPVYGGVVSNLVDGQGGKLSSVKNLEKGTLLLAMADGVFLWSNTVSGVYPATFLAVKYDNNTSVVYNVSGMQHELLVKPNQKVTRGTPVLRLGNLEAAYVQTKTTLSAALDMFVDGKRFTLLFNSPTEADNFWLRECSSDRYPLYVAWPGK